MENTRRYENESGCLCANGCGFFGSPQTQNLCSKCYSDYLKQQMTETFRLLSISPNPPNPIPSSPNTGINSIGTFDSERKNTEGIDAPAEKYTEISVKNRCKSCKKKVGLIGFNCRCGGFFCRIHRYPEKHECGFDYKTVGRAALIRENPLVKADKLQDRA